MVLHRSRLRVRNHPIAWHRGCMDYVTPFVARQGGFARTSELVEAGFTKRDLSAAVAGGALRRPRRGVYSTLPPSDDRFQAVALGGLVTGAAALRRRGAWMWRDPPLSVTVSAQSGFARASPPGVVVRWDPPEVLARGFGGVVDPLDAFPHALRELTFEEGVALLDWGRRSGCLDTFDLYAVVERLPRRQRDIADWVDDECQSFIESIVRTRMRQAGHRTTTQVGVTNGQWIDVVVDDVIALEIDGREFHESTFESDRAKDLAITADGRHAIRVSYSMIESRWAEVLRAVETALEMRRRFYPVRGRPRPRPRGMQAAGARLPPS